MTDSLGSSDVLFVSRGANVVGWYRCGMPSLYLGSDWIAILGEPGDLYMPTSLKRGGVLDIPNFEDYKIVVLQQVQGRKWLKEIRRLKEKGVKVFYEVDDYLHGVHKIQQHGSKEAFSKKKLVEFELCMRECDGMIVSTEWLAKRYAKYNANIHVCTNSIERARYEKLALPERDTINIGWAGGEGHQKSSLMWLPAVRGACYDHENVRFVSIGLDAASHLGMEGRSLSIPFVTIEQFPAVLTNMDIAIAPAMKNNFFAAKSDLRFLETAALGIPCVAHEFVYGKTIEDTVTGLLCGDKNEDARADLEDLIVDEPLRKMIGDKARDYVYSKRSIEHGIDQWIKVFTTA